MKHTKMKNNWVSQMRFLLRMVKIFVKDQPKIKIKVGPSELCQNQKNTIDPEKMIENYGADAVRLLYYLTALLRCAMV